MRRSDLATIARAERTLERLDGIEADVRAALKLGVAGIRDGDDEPTKVLFPDDDPELNAAIRAAVLDYCQRPRASVRQQPAELGVELETAPTA